MKRLILFSLLLITACGPDIEAYKDQEPKLDVRHYFNGRLTGVGTIKDPYSGEVTDRFTVEALGAWEGDMGQLKEKFTFADGRTEKRLWTLQVNDAGKVLASAEDVVGPRKGKQLGNAMFSDYTITRMEEGKANEYSVSDRMILVDDLYLTDERHMTQFGLPVSEMNITFHRLNEWN